MLYDAISCHMFSWAPLLVMGPGTVYRLYPPLGGPVHGTRRVSKYRLFIPNLLLHYIYSISGDQLGVS